MVWIRGLKTIILEFVIMLCTNYKQMCYKDNLFCFPLRAIVKHEPARYHRHIGMIEFLKTFITAALTSVMVIINLKFNRK
jgi:hypothetical protein